MKKLAILCALVGAIGLTGCGEGEETTAQSADGYGTVAGDSIPTVNLTQPAPAEPVNDTRSDVIPAQVEDWDGDGPRPVATIKNHE